MTTSPAKIEDFCQLPYKGERAERCQWQEKRGERVAAVEKIEEKRKPEDFFGHRNRKPRALPRRCENGILCSKTRRELFCALSVKNQRFLPALP